MPFSKYWLTDWLTDWIDWLIDWLTDLLTTMQRPLVSSFLLVCAAEMLIEVWALDCFSWWKEAFNEDCGGSGRAQQEQRAEVGCNCYIKQTRPNMSCQLSFRLSRRQPPGPSSIHLLCCAIVPRAPASAAEPETFVDVVVVAATS